ncbi:hypothetical protein MMC10_008879 [Thelotrema lepadinum]|nr:hypothetical protein [Thelotrema lepadinum]
MPQTDELMSLPKSNSLVRNTMLAITACHLRTVSPGVLQYRIAEHFQTSLALQDYQRALDVPQEKLGQAGADALLLSAVLLNILAFALPESETPARLNDDADPRTSWVFSTHKNRLGWLALQAGVRPLMRSMVPYFESALSFLGLIFFGTRGENWVLFQRNLDLGVPETWIKVFELESTDCDGECGTINSLKNGDASQDQPVVTSHPKPINVYHIPVIVLAQLRTLEFRHSYVFKNLFFLGKVQSEFRALLYHRDERALWLFGYWLGLMCRFEKTWWCDGRAKRDYQAIRMWLEQLHLAERPGVEGEMWRELMQDFRAAPVFNTL